MSQAGEGAREGARDEDGAAARAREKGQPIPAPSAGKGDAARSKSRKKSKSPESGTSLWKRRRMINMRLSLLTENGDLDPVLMGQLSEEDAAELRALDEELRPYEGSSLKGSSDHDDLSMSEGEPAALPAPKAKGKAKSKAKAKAKAKSKAGKGDRHDEGDDEMARPKPKPGRKASAKQEAEDKEDEASGSKCKSRAGKPSFARRASPATVPALTKWQAIKNVFEQEIKQQLVSRGEPVSIWEEICSENESYIVKAHD